MVLKFDKSIPENRSVHENKVGSTKLFADSALASHRSNMNTPQKVSRNQSMANLINGDTQKPDCACSGIRTFHHSQTTSVDMDKIA